VALTCARCGAQNPDGNQFCQACGTPLSAVAPGASPAPPPPLPVAYASPYYNPAGAAPQAAVHRTPWVLIISAIVVLLLVMAGCGTAIALLGAGAPSLGGSVAGLPSPTPGTSPNPLASPTSAFGATSVSNAAATVPLPTGWTVSTQDAESVIVVNSNSTGSVTVASGASNPRMTAQQNKDEVDRSLKSKYPDTAPCPGSKTTTGNINGAQGLFWNVCFTLTSSGRSLPAVASLFVGANSDGSVYYLVMLATSQSNLQNFTFESKPVVQGIVWKLK
jgi:hypothetical protein